MDIFLFRALNDFAGYGYWTDYVAWVLAQATYWLIGIPMTLLWFFARDRSRMRRRILLALISGVIALGLAQIPAFFYYRPRPYLTLPGAFDLINSPPSASFPSTHAAVSYAIAVQMGWGSSLLGLYYWLISIAVTFARVYAGVHYPSDKLAGLLVGIFTALFLRWLEPELRPALDAILALFNPKRHTQ